ncbi:FxSxx-COOH system tetratricopeptide repeat protein [Streptomyces sp. NPDC002623]
MTQTQLAARAAVSRTTVWNALREGGPVPAGATVAALARALRLKQPDVNELLRLRRTAAAAGDATRLGESARGGVSARRGPQPPGAVCRVLGDVPLEADCFVPRPGLRARVETAATGGTVALSQVVLTGMGGVGKTQLAARHARTAIDSGQVDLVLWVTAASRTAVADAYADAASRLLGAGREDPQAASEFLNWLRLGPGTADGGPRPGLRWLVVLDDVPYTAAVRGLWPPHVPHGQTLVTTRFRDVSLLRAGSRRVEVDRFTSAEAVSYLTAKLEALGRADDLAQLTGLAEDLGRLPLALSQAVPFMHALHLDCAGYRTRLAGRAQTLTTVLPTDIGLPDDQNKTVAAAWDLSIDRADRQPRRGLARPLLHVLSLLDPNGVPAPVLDSPPVRSYLATHRTPLSDPDAPVRQPGDEPGEVGDIGEVLRNLEQFSVIDCASDNPHRAVRVHQLIQRAVREQLSPEHRDQVARAAADALTAAWPDVERDTDLAAALRANTAVLAGHAGEALYRPVTHPVLGRSGTSLGTSGQVGAARDYYQHLAEQAVAHLGEHRPDTLLFRQQAARWQGEAGDVAGAAAALTDVLAEQRRHLDADHPDLLASRNSIAYTKALAGDLAGAVADFIDVLDDTRRVLGDDHPDTLLLRNNLARFRGEAGDPATAVTEFQELLEDQKRLLGDHDSDTLMTLNNLAYQQVMAGDICTATATFAELLDVRSQVLGADHPHTLDTRNNVAYLQARAGDVVGAASAFARLAEDSARIRGAGHPATLQVRSHLAQCWGQAGDAVRAATALDDIVRDCVRLLGREHPHTLKSWSFLAEWRVRAGDPSGAAAAYADLLPLQTRVLGAHHPDTLKSRQELARRSAR